MPAPKPEPEVAAVQQVFEALKPLAPDSQQRVLSSALALLGMSFGSSAAPPSSVNRPSTPVAAAQPGSRPKGLTEFLTETQPGTSAQRITVFAYYRDRFEHLPTFSRADLRPYFPKAKLTPPTNFDRDFSTAVEKGWIHEDGSNSYITQRGATLVESGFEGARSYPEDRATSKVKAPKKTKKK